MTEHNEPNFESVAEVAHDLGVSEKHIRRLMKNGELPFYRFGHAIRVNRQDKEKYLKSCLQKTTSRPKYFLTPPNIDI